jgi:hypothetical protein
VRPHLERQVVDPLVAEEEREHGDRERRQARVAPERRRLMRADPAVAEPGELRQKAEDVGAVRAQARAPQRERFGQRPLWREAELARRRLRAVGRDSSCGGVQLCPRARVCEPMWFSALRARDPRPT